MIALIIPQYQLNILLISKNTANDIDRIIPKSEREIPSQLYYLLTSSFTEMKTNLCPQEFLLHPAFAFFNYDFF
jgi:hypothetical protein